MKDLTGPLTLENLEAEKEIWNPVVGFKGLYEVSNQGKVKSIRTGNFLKQHLSRKKYLKVTLRKNDRSYHLFVAVLVLEAFDCPRPFGLQCAHNNGIKSDNRVSNLRWATPKENSQDRVLHDALPTGERNGMTKITESDAVFIIKNYRKVNAIESNAMVLAKKYGVCRDTILRLIKGETWIRSKKVEQARIERQHE